MIDPDFAIYDGDAIHVHLELKRRFRCYLSMINYKHIVDMATG